jgi:aspartate oxidase
LTGVIVGIKVSVNNGTSVGNEEFVFIHPTHTIKDKLASKVIGFG